MHDLPRRTMPARPALALLIGPGLVWMALAQGSGELIWWPYIVAKYGLGFLCLLVPACLLQFPVTFELGRYTVLTGEGVFRGFVRLNRAYGISLWVLFTLSFLWFGAFASAGGTAMAALTDVPAGLSARGQTLVWAQGSIVVFTIALLWAPVAYRLIEWVMKVVAVVSLVGMLLACMHPRVRDAVGDFVTGLFVPDLDEVRRFDRADTSRLLTAIAFAGLGGFWTLFYSYWLKAKGIGMAGANGATEAGHGALPAAEPTALERVRAWYRFLGMETLIGIVGNLVTTLMACLLAFAILRPQGLFPDKYELAVVQSEFFAASWGHAGRVLFLIVAASFLADTWLATVDGVARIHLDVLGSLWPGFAGRDAKRWYRGLVVALAVITSATMYIDEPGPLIVTSALIGFFGTVVYCAGLFVLNHVHLRAHLDPPLRSGLLARAGLIVATLVYLSLAVVYLAVRYG